MEVYIIDFGLASSIPEGNSLWHVHFHDREEVGTPGYYLRDLVNFDLQSPIEHKYQQMFNHGFSSSLFNDRVAMSKMIAELMMGPFININVMSRDFKWQRFRFKSWIEWFLFHQTNECTLHNDHRYCISQRELWNQYTFFPKFLVDLTDPRLFRVQDNTVNFWKESFDLSIKTRL